MHEWTDDTKLREPGDRRKPFRPGKTKREHASGVWLNHRRNRDDRARQNRGK